MRAVAHDPSARARRLAWEDDAIRLAEAALLDPDARFERLGPPGAPGNAAEVDNLTGSERVVRSRRAAAEEALEDLAHWQRQARGGGKARAGGCASAQPAEGDAGEIDPAPVPYSSAVLFGYASPCAGPDPRLRWCCYTPDGDLIVGQDGKPVYYPFCDPALCTPEYIATTSGSTRRDLEAWCPKVGETTDEPGPSAGGDEDCFHPDFRSCEPPQLITSDMILTSGDLTYAKQMLEWDRSHEWFEPLRDLVARALMVLQSNLDLVKYACCLSWGPSSQECRCLIARLMGFRGPYVMEWAGGVPTTGAPVGNPRSDKGRLVFYQSAVDSSEGTSGRSTARQWEAVRGTGSVDEQTILFEWAGILAHEFMHDCWTATTPAHEAPYTDQGWVSSGSIWQQQNCDLSARFSVGPSDGQPSGFTITELLWSRYA